MITSKQVLIGLAILTTLASSAFWWAVESTLTTNGLVAASYSAINVIGLPFFLAFFIPDTAIGMLLARTRWKTTGQVVAFASLVVMFLHTSWMMWAWWAAQPITVANDIVLHQVGIGLVAVCIQALVIQPAMSGDAVQKLKQAHLVKRYELQAESEIAIMRATLHRALSLTNKRMRTQLENEELSGIMFGLTSSIDKSLKEVNETVFAVTGIDIQIPLLLDSPDVVGAMDYIADTIEEKKKEETVRFQVPGRSHEYHLPVIRWTTNGAIVKNNSGKEVLIENNLIIRT